MTPGTANEGYPNFNLQNTRYRTGPINAGNVSKLKPVWKATIKGRSQYGSYASSPIILGGVVYSQDLASNVEAFDLKSGKVLWRKSYESPDEGPNGLAVANGDVYGTTADTAFALDARTGRELWSVKLVRNGHEGIDMAPGFHNGIVYVSTVPGNLKVPRFYGGGGVGILWALDGKTGRRIWHFDTVPTNLWSSKHTSINSGGGLWYSPSFDSEGYMYIGVGNPGPFPGTKQYPWGSSRPGPNLYTDSLVKLNAATGKLKWYYQLTPHDVYDHDLQDPPILVTSNNRHLVLAAGKAGIVIAVDSQTGKLVWKRAVGVHNGHDADSVHAMRHEYAKLQSRESVYPGLLGGVIAPMATDGSTVFVPVVNLQVAFADQEDVGEGPIGTGELVAINVSSGAVRWRHAFSTPAPAAATVVNDVVFTTTFDGTLYAFNSHTGKLLRQGKLPAGTNAGVSVSGNTVLAPAGLVQNTQQKASLSALRLTG